ncbi:phosphotransferase [Candidatus Woesearchaeota archaeon]|nr:phosphotransferase [Candidatus Woesearchaeota archaeon]
MIQSYTPKQSLAEFLRNYDIRKFRLKYLREGIENVNIFIDADHKKYVLRIYQNRSENDIKAEVETISYLYKIGIPTPTIYQNNRGSYYGKTRGKYAALFSFTAGEHPPKGLINGNLAREIGVKLANMQVALMKFKTIHERSFPYADDFTEFKQKYSLIDDYILDKKKVIVSELEDIIISALRKAIIHGDITRENLLVTKQRLTSFLDFDDCHKDYIVWDTSIAITQLFITKTSGIDWNGLRKFLEGYTEIMHLNEPEKEAVIPFLKLRNIKIAMQVNYMMNSSKRRNTRLKSIELSTLFKIDLIERYKKEIQDLIREAL